MLVLLVLTRAHGLSFSFWKGGRVGGGQRGWREGGRSDNRRVFEFGGNKREIESRAWGRKEGNKRLIFFIRKP